MVFVLDGLTEALIIDTVNFMASKIVVIWIFNHTFSASDVV
jgi:hypothetical protein